MVTTPSGAPDASHAREENELLRAENLRLRAAVSAVRPDTPAEPASIPPTPGGSSAALQAADRLVQLMREGGQLLKEREALREENGALERELEVFAAEGEAELPEGREEPDAGPAENSRTPPVEVEEAETPSTLLAVDRLMPLLSEGDALRAEREGLRAEREELLGELQAMGPPLPDEAAHEEEQLAADAELESRFLAAVEEASREHASLKAEVRGLREENARLRRKSSKEGAENEDGAYGDAYSYDTPRRLKGAIRPEAFEEDIDTHLQQQEAMAELLKRARITSPTSHGGPQSMATAARELSDLDRGQEMQLKGALHTLFQNFPR